MDRQYRLIIEVTDPGKGIRKQDIGGLPTPKAVRNALNSALSWMHKDLERADPIPQREEPQDG